MQPILLPKLTPEQEAALRDMSVDPEKLRKQVEEFVSAHPAGSK